MPQRLDAVIIAPLLNMFHGAKSLILDVTFFVRNNAFVHLWTSLPSLATHSMRVVAGVGLCSGAVVLVYHLLRSSKRISINFVKLGHVSDIVLYPVTSCQGFHIDQCEVTEIGLEFRGLTDRQFIVAKQSDHGLYQFHSDQMEELQVFFDGEVITFSAQGNPPLNWRFSNSHLDRLVVVTLLEVDFKVNALHCGDRIANWFSVVLEETDLHLLMCIRNRQLPYTLNSIVLANFDSTRELNIMFNSHISLNSRYLRANIVIKGCQPLDEERWNQLKIGQSTILSVIAPHTMFVQHPWDSKALDWRQQVTAINIELGKVVCIPASFPMTPAGATSYPLRPGCVSLGDPVYVTYKETPKKCGYVTPRRSGGYETPKRYNSKNSSGHKLHI